MRISIKCSSAVHMLLVIASLSAEKKVTSSLLASSVGCNPVEVRKLLSSLKKAGIINVSRGPGGATLNKEPDDITLLDIYSAVDSASLDELIGLHANAATMCPIGKNIYNILAEPYEEIGSAIRDKMATITLKQLLERLYTMEPSLLNI
ncbi:Rrf2 family transcriptional regulator [Tyzzerella sp. OttesenSCG-928-J15]|nr:Rrf2 family transcriptional regulator [Tyzzerella sp. OttesenSCG-928-J15]